MRKPKAPAFQWYPKDCDTDERVKLMTHEEFGFYVRCLNHAWLNNGLPNSIQRIARLMGNSIEDAERLWSVVGECFNLENERFVNRKQEEQRMSAREFVESRRKASASRWERPKTSSDGLEDDDARGMHVDTESDARGMHVHPQNGTKNNARAMHVESSPKGEAEGEAEGDIDSSSSKSQKSKVSTIRPAEDWEAMVEPAVQRMLSAHPVPSSPHDSQIRLYDYLANSLHPAKVIKSIEATHAAWCQHWKEQIFDWEASGRPGKRPFVPFLPKFITDGYCSKQPPSRDSPSFSNREISSRPHPSQIL